MIVTDALNYFSGGYLFPEQSYTSGETLIKELSQYSQCKALIEEAQNVVRELGLPAVEVRFEPLSHKSRAEQDKNIIRIKTNLSASNQRDVFIFELTNVIQHKKHLEIWEAAKKGIYKSAEEYARAVEFIEYNGLNRKNVISRAMNKQNGRFFRSYMENPWEYIPVKTMGFNLFYNLFIPDWHKEHYRKYWRDLNNIKNPTTDVFKNILKITLGVQS